MDQGGSNYHLFAFDGIPKYRLFLTTIPMKMSTQTGSFNPYVETTPMAECKTSCLIDFANGKTGDNEDCNAPQDVHDTRY